MIGAGGGMKREILLALRRVFITSVRLFVMFEVALICGDGGWTEVILNSKSSWKNIE